MAKGHRWNSNKYFLKFSKRTGDDGKRKRHLFSLPSVPRPYVLFPSPQTPLPFDLPYDTKSPLRSRERERPRKLQTRSLRIRHCTNEQGTRAQIHPASVSGIVGGEEPFRYWPIFSLSLVTVPEVLTRVNSSQFPSGISS